MPILTLEVCCGAGWMETVSEGTEMHGRSGEKDGCAKKLCGCEDGTHNIALGLVDMTQ